MKIVFLDAKTIGDDIDLSGYDALGEVVKYGFSTPEEARERTRDADVIVLNKVVINEQSIGEAEHLKLVCVTATGTNNLDKEYLDQRGIAWRNVAGYSTETVAQHTFALLFYLLEKLHYYDEYVKSEKYVGDVSFTHFDNVFHELSGKTWGVIGLGAIGRRVADIAGMFGCRVLYYSTSGKHDQPGYERVDFDTLLAESDIVSVHAPLDANTEGLMNAGAFAKMKKSAIFLNLGRDESRSFHVAYSPEKSPTICSVVRLSRTSFTGLAGFTAIVRASIPTWYSFSFLIASFSSSFTLLATIPNVAVPSITALVPCPDPPAET